MWHRGSHWELLGTFADDQEKCKGVNNISGRTKEDTIRTQQSKN